VPHVLFIQDQKHQPAIEALKKCIIADSSLSHGHRKKEGNGRRHKRGSDNAVPGCRLTADAVMCSGSARFLGRMCNLSGV
jgi:hypothetical protein